MEERMMMWSLRGGGVGEKLPLYMGDALLVCLSGTEEEHVAACRPLCVSSARAGVGCRKEGGRRRRHWATWHRGGRVGLVCAGCRLQLICRRLHFDRCVLLKRIANAMLANVRVARKSYM